jgi:urease gamma subunit
MKRKTTPTVETSNTVEFKDLVFNKASHVKQAIVWFDNGYGASIVTSELIMGARNGHYELAVLDKGTNNILYNTEITDNVLNFLSEDEVSKVLVRIKNLK